MDVKLKDYISVRINAHKMMSDKLYKETRELVEAPVIALFG